MRFAQNGLERLLALFRCEDACGPLALWLKRLCRPFPCPDLQVNYVPIPSEVFASFGFPGAEDLAAMFKYFVAAPYTPEDEVLRKANPRAKTFAQWLAQPAVQASFKKAMGL
jgi:hypothetical protein